MYCVYKNKRFDTNVPQIVGDVQYPAHWFDDAEARKAAGIIEAIYVDPPAVKANQKAVASVVKQGEDWMVAWGVEDVVIPVPFAVTRRQARQALAIKGLLDNIETAIDKLDDGTPAGKQKALLVKIEWQDSLNFERNRPLVVQIGKVVGLSDDELDDLFRFAATL